MSEKPALTLRDTIAPKSDQLNYDDVATCSVSVRVTGLAAGSAEQPVIVRIARLDNDAPMRDFKPCKSMRRVLIAAWGDKGRDWIGQSMTLYGDSGVVFGGVAVGGIRISHVSGITEELRVKLTTTRSKRSDYIVRPMEASNAPAAPMDRARAVEILTAASKIAGPFKRLMATRDLTPENWQEGPERDLIELAEIAEKAAK